ncbi:MAG TPA: PHP domain-containing protein, partial [Candidatus Bathyarchaeota archaeon]|nr:PHP domain-containing protein [Candidatus Bathyarchaeota archaeon]
MIRLDLHVHTQYSYDSKTTLKQVFRAAEKAGLDGVAITDHGTVEGALKALRLKPKIFVVPGMEVDAKGGHILALGVRERVPEGLSVLETVERIHELGGLAVASHLYAFFKSCHWSLEELSSFDAIEVINASAIPFGRSTRRSFRVARALGLPMVA